jgi:hypothetical protein
MKRKQTYAVTVLAFRDTSKGLCMDNNGETKWKGVSTQGDTKKITPSNMMVQLLILNI